MEHATPPHYDSVVMLTFSNWRTEMRSNRYHYASRFARDVPVLFVQADQFRFRCRLEPTELPNVTLLHASQLYGRRQAEAIVDVLQRQGIARPLLWIYNHHFTELIYNLRAVLKVYHATEDYFFADIHPSIVRSELQRALQACDLLVAVSAGVERDYRTEGGFSGRTCVLNNGCDFSFWSDVSPSRLALASQQRRKVLFFQGGINRRLDFTMLRAVAERLTDWTMAFCGPDHTHWDGSWTGWHQLRQLPNVEYWGVLSPVELKEAMCRATVGMIPFVSHPAFSEVSRPLKAFEYMACGIPVVSVPIAGLQQYGDLFRFADMPEQFAKQVQQCGREAFDEAAVQRRLLAASREDYDQRFLELRQTLDQMVSITESETTTLLSGNGRDCNAPQDCNAPPWSHRLPDALLAGFDRLPVPIQRLAIKTRLLP